MDNIEKIIDDMILDLEELLGQTSERQIDNKIDLNKEQEDIKRFLDERRINFLIHFTDKENINSIKKYGILSVKELNKRNIAFRGNDKERFDGEIDHISLSISKINKYVYNQFKRDKKINYGIAILVDPKILYEQINQHRFYCIKNAAGKNSKGSGIIAFKKMFTEMVEYNTNNFEHMYRYDRVQDNLFSYETTDPQAEILFENHIDVKYILGFIDLEKDFFYSN